MCKKKFYIVCLMNKDNVCRKIENTTYKMNIQNQAYRQTYLSKCDGNELCISRAGASMDGGGLEMLRLQIHEDAEGCILEGRFEMLPYIKSANKVLTVIVLAGCIPFVLNGGVAIIAGLSIIALSVLLHKMILHICVSEEGQEKVIDYIRTTLDVKRMGYIYETDTPENIYDIYCQNKWRLGDIKEGRWDVIEENKDYNLQLYNENKDFVSIFIRQDLEEREDIIKEVTLILNDLNLDIQIEGTEG